MNKAKKINIPKILLVVMLIGSLLGVHVMEVMAISTNEGTTDQQPTVIVSNFSQLYSAIIQAKDGDVIGIDDTITIQAKDETLGKTDKHITIMRMNDAARFEFAAKPFKVQNVTFDGKGIKAWFSMVQVNTDTIFENVTFKNCHTDMYGGAMFISGGNVTITDCIFQNNSASSGGHLSIWNDSYVKIDRCTFEGGYASLHGGAIEYNSSATWCRITSSVIYNNSAGSCGGGIFNNKRMVIEQTKIYGNSASTGGADIANSIYSNMQIEHSIEELSTLYQNDKIIPKGWINDYDFDSGVLIADISPTITNSLMKLDYKVIPTEVILAESSLGVAGNSKITGLEADKHYKVFFGETVSYSKADGTLTLEESEAAPLIGTEINGLTNGNTYRVEEHIKIEPTPEPEPTLSAVILESSSLGIAGDGKITDLTAGKKYRVSVDGTTSYSTSDGTLTSKESEVSGLIGTEIIGLVNGKIYNVEEYKPIPTEEPTPSPTPTPTPGEDDNDNKDPDPTPTPEPEKPKPTPSPSPDKNDTTNNTTTNNDNSTIREDHSSTRNDYSGSNNTSTVHNYYTTEEAKVSSDESVVAVMAQPSPSPIYESVKSDTASTTPKAVEQEAKEDTDEAAASTPKNIRIEANGADVVFELNEDGYNISINANSNNQEVKADAPDASSTNWYEVAKIGLLAAIAFTLFWKPRRTVKNDPI